MDNLNYVSKKLLAEYNFRLNTDYEVVEKAYIQGNDSFIIEYKGGCYSQYAVATDFFHSIGRTGAYTLNKVQFETWKKIREENSRENLGKFTLLSLTDDEKLEIDLNDYFKKLIGNNHKEQIDKINDDDLPF